jgi:hypothetical protein
MILLSYNLRCVLRWHTSCGTQSTVEARRGPRRGGGTAANRPRSPPGACRSRWTCRVSTSSPSAPTRSTATCPAARSRTPSTESARFAPKKKNVLASRRGFNRRHPKNNKFPTPPQLTRVDFRVSLTILSQLFMYLDGCVFPWCISLSRPPAYCERVFSLSVCKYIYTGIILLFPKMVKINKAPGGF